MWPNPHAHHCTAAADDGLPLSRLPADDRERVFAQRGVPAAGFAVIEGEPVIGGLHGPSRHYHCPHCKSWLFTRPEGMDEMVNVRAMMLDDAAWIAPFAETCRAEGFAWAQTGARHSFDGIPANETFGPLIAEFADSGPRPRD